MTRFSDGPRTEASVRLVGRPEDVWPTITDLDLPVPHSPELQRVELTAQDEPLGVGATFRGFNRRGDVAWDTLSTIERWEPPLAWSWAVGDPGDAISRWGFELEADGESHTIVRQWCELGPGRSGLTWAIKQNPDAEEQIVEGRLTQLRASMQATLDALA